MPLLQCHRQGCETVLGGQTLIGPRTQQEPDHAVVVLLGSHVQGGEAILGLNVHLKYKGIRIRVIFCQSIRCFQIHTIQYCEITKKKSGVSIVLPRVDINTVIRFDNGD